MVKGSLNPGNRILIVGKVVVICTAVYLVSPCIAFGCDCMLCPSTTLLYCFVFMELRTTLDDPCKGSPRSSFPLFLVFGSNKVFLHCVCVFKLLIIRDLII